MTMIKSVKDSLLMSCFNCVSLRKELINYINTNLYLLSTNLLKVKPNLIDKGGLFYWIYCEENI